MRSRGGEHARKPGGDGYPTRETVLLYLVERGAIEPDSRPAEILRAIATLPPDRLDVASAAEASSMSRRTLARVLRCAGLPSPGAWIGLARALRAHRAILKGGTLRQAAIAAGYHDQFTLSNAIQRMIGVRPSALLSVSWRRLVDLWIARQRTRGALSAP